MILIAFIYFLLLSCQTICLLYIIEDNAIVFASVKISCGLCGNYVLVCSMRQIFFFLGGGSASVGSGFLNPSKYYKESLSIDCDTKIPSHHMVQCTVEQISYIHIPGERVMGTVIKRCSNLEVIFSLRRRSLDCGLAVLGVRISKQGAAWKSRVQRGSMIRLLKDSPEFKSWLAPIERSSSPFNLHRLRGDQNWSRLQRK